MWHASGCGHNRRKACEQIRAYSAHTLAANVTASRGMKLKVQCDDKVGPTCRLLKAGMGLETVCTSRRRHYLF